MHNSFWDFTIISITELLSISRYIYLSGLLHSYTVALFSGLIGVSFVLIEFPCTGNLFSHLASVFFMIILCLEFTHIRDLFSNLVGVSV